MNDGEGTLTMTAPRSPQQRKQDALDRLERDVDGWVATADAIGGVPYLVPLSFLWDGETLLVATPAASPTGRNLRANGYARVGLGETRDVVLIEGIAEALALADVAPEVGDAFAVKTGFDPRTLTTPYRYFRIRPRRIQVWRETDELAGREVMRGGRWLTP
ncbi:MAG TPA: pyridoxamine 5'-phosphate oxidase family protein [Thermomicrobiales bacterium]|nr:pyridoxamine 5'-phosphate oxidase family protein [Thermomicrobiales bacterium]